MDLNMSPVSGVEATRAICAEHPRACVLALTTFGTRNHIVAALKAGAAGYLLKDSSPSSCSTASVRRWTGTCRCPPRSGGSWSRRSWRMAASSLRWR
ncbi:response regulator [Tessaracoccus coleopterorum]|uniref:response regulator n=1 Tax=Tessaracoccus coleopterorum TaxID=2714950 RepID=UPI0018D3C082|nr:response regulator transcription factor [Tessaracoccus coleopterorum]